LIVVKSKASLPKKKDLYLTDNPSIIMQLNNQGIISIVAGICLILLTLTIIAIYTL